MKVRNKESKKERKKERKERTRERELKTGRYLRGGAFAPQGWAVYMGQAQGKRHGK